MDAFKWLEVVAPFYTAVGEAVEELRGCRNRREELLKLLSGTDQAIQEARATIIESEENLVRRKALVVVGQLRESRERIERLLGEERSVDALILNAQEAHRCPR